MNGMNRKLCKNNGQTKICKRGTTYLNFTIKIAKEEYCFFQKMFFQKLEGKYLFQFCFGGSFGNFSWNVLENLSKKKQARHPCHGGFSHRDPHIIEGGRHWCRGSRVSVVNGTACFLASMVEKIFF